MIEIVFNSLDTMSAKQRFIHLLSIQNIKLFKLLPNTRGTLLRPEIATLKLHSGRMSYLYFAVSATNVKFIVKISFCVDFI